MCLCTRRVHRMFHLVVVAVALRTYTQTHSRCWCALVNVIVPKICAYYYFFLSTFSNIYDMEMRVYTPYERDHTPYTILCARIFNQNITKIILLLYYIPLHTGQQQQQQQVAGNRATLLTTRNADSQSFLPSARRSRVLGNRSQPAKTQAKKLL